MDVRTRERTEAGAAAPARAHGRLVALLTLAVAGVIAAAAQSQVAALRHDSQDRHVITNAVEAQAAFTTIRRQFQGDRALVDRYVVADLHTRTALREELTKRQATMATLIERYRPHVANAAAFAAFTASLTSYYDKAEQGLAIADGDRTTAFDRYLADVIRPAADAVFRSGITEADAQTKLITSRSEAGDTRISGNVLRVGLPMIAMAAIAVLAGWTIRRSRPLAATA